jgi:hypothetical protein
MSTTLRYTRLLLPCVVGCALAGPVLAGNARSNQTARSFVRNVYRMQTRNAQWAQHFQAQQRDTAFTYADPATALAERRAPAVLQQRSQENQRRWWASSPQPQQINIPSRFGASRR